MDKIFEEAVKREQEIIRLKDELAAAKAELAACREDAERFRTFGAQVGAETDGRGRQQFTYPDIEDSRVNLMQGSVYQHWCAAIDATRKEGA